MEDNNLITPNGITNILSDLKINEDHLTDIYLLLIGFNCFEKKQGYYICEMKDDKNSFKYFILKSNNALKNNIIIHLTKIKTFLLHNKKFVMCLQYEIIKQINDKSQNLLVTKTEEKHLNNNQKHENEIINKDTMKSDHSKNLDTYKNNLTANKNFNYLSNLVYEKNPKRYFFNWDKGNLKIVNKFKNSDNNKRKTDSNKISNNKISPNDNRYNIENKNKLNIEIEENKDKNLIKKDYVKGSINQDNEDINDSFQNIDFQKLFKDEIDKDINNNKLNQEFELIINLTTTNNKKPIYVKCMKKVVESTKKDKYIFYIFRDSEGTEITAYTYGICNIQYLNNQIKENNVYIITKYNVRPISSTTHINLNYRLILNNNTKIKPMPDDSIFNNIHFHFLNIEDLFYFKEGCIIDTCGIIYDEGESRIFNMKKGQQLMRNIIIGDNTMKKIIITLYEPFSKNSNIKFKKGEILAIKYGKIGITNSNIKKLLTNNYTILQNTTTDYKHDLSLRKLYKQYPNLDNFLYIHIKDEYKFLKEIENIMKFNIENNIKEYKLIFITKAIIEKFQLDINSIYIGCKFCYKKLQLLDNKVYKCTKCNKIFIEPNYIFKLTFKVRDTEGSAYFKLLGNKADKLLNIEPITIKKYIDENEFDKLKEIENTIINKEYLFTCNLNIFGTDIDGKVLHNINIINLEKAEGENLKRIIDLLEE